MIAGAAGALLKSPRIDAAAHETQLDFLGLVPLRILST